MEPRAPALLLFCRVESFNDGCPGPSGGEMSPKLVRCELSTSFSPRLQTFVSEAKRCSIRFSSLEKGQESTENSSQYCHP